MSNVSRSARLPMLDGLRGIAAMVVLYRHAGGFDFAGSFAAHGHLFVDFFFMLSGFVLGLSADPKLRAGASAAGFIEARLRRLWPVIAIGTLIGTIPFALTYEPLPTAELLAVSLALIPTFYIAGPLFPLNTVAWSLSMELIANIFHALILSRVGQRTLALTVIVSGVLLFMSILRFGGNIFGNTSDLWIEGIPRLFFSYGFGLLLARERLARNRLARLRLPWWLCLIAPVLVVIDLPVILPRGPACDALVTLLFFPVLFACTTNARAPKEAEQTFAGLGLLSYPLYAVHLPVMTLVAQWCAPSIGSFVGPAAALVLAALLARVFEQRGSRSPICSDAAVSRSNAKAVA